MVGIKNVNMEEKIYEVLRKHKLPLKKREELMVDLCDLFGVSGCSFALWLQDNYSTNEKQGSDKHLPKGYWREDFTDKIHKVEDLWVVFNNR